MIEIKGIHGTLTGSELYHWTIVGWFAMQSKPNTEIGLTQLESSIPITELGKLDEPKVIFQTTDWKGMNDESQPHDGLNSTESTKAIVTVEASISSGTTTAYSCQRKLFYTGSYYFSFYYNNTAGDTFYEYSSDGSSWSNAPLRVFSFPGVNYVSVWHDDVYVYVVGDTPAVDDNVTVVRGTISGSTITWDQETNVTVSLMPLASKVSFISQDSSGYLWIVSRVQTGAPNIYGVVAVMSTNPNDVRTWAGGTTIRTNLATTDIFPIILPISNTQDMYALWYQSDGASQAFIEGKLYIGGAWMIAPILIGSSAVSNPDGRGPSAVVDSAYVLHIIFSDSSGDVRYRRFAGGLSPPMTLDMSISTKLYPTITVLSNDDLYAFWINTTAGMSQITGKYSTDGGGSWIWISGISTDTMSKKHLTSGHSVSNDYWVGWQWKVNQNAPPMYNIQFERLPEFSDVMMPMAFVVLLAFYFRRRKKTQEFDGKDEIT
jgi:hypothetical protein